MIARHEAPRGPGSLAVRVRARALAQRRRCSASARLASRRLVAQVRALQQEVRSLRAEKSLAPQPPMRAPAAGSVTEQRTGYRPRVVKWLEAAAALARVRVEEVPAFCGSA